MFNNINKYCIILISKLLYMDYKYNKYKKKYIDYKNQSGGAGSGAGSSSIDVQKIVDIQKPYLYLQNLKWFFQSPPDIQVISDLKIPNNIEKHNETFYNNGAARTAFIENIKNFLTKFNNFNKNLDFNTTLIDIKRLISAETTPDDSILKLFNTLEMTCKYFNTDYNNYCDFIKLLSDYFEKYMDSIENTTPKKRSIPNTSYEATSTTNILNLNHAIAEYSTNTTALFELYKKFIIAEIQFFNKVKNLKLTGFDKINGFLIIDNKSFVENINTLSIYLINVTPLIIIQDELEKIDTVSTCILSFTSEDAMINWQLNNIIDIYKKSLESRLLNKEVIVRKYTRYKTIVIEMKNFANELNALITKIGINSYEEKNIDEFFTFQKKYCELENKANIIINEYKTLLT